MKKEIPNNKIVSLSNNLIKGSYKLSLLEQRLILMIISNVYNASETGQKNITSDRFYEVKKEDYINFFGKVDNDELVEATKELIKARIEYKDEKGKTFIINWLQGCYYDNRTVNIRFTDLILPLINELERNFTYFCLRDIAKLKSSYSIRIFQLALSTIWQGGKSYYTLDTFKKLLGIEDEYEIYGNLKKFIINRVENDINNGQETIKVKFDEKKAGRKVIGLELTVISCRKIEKIRKEEELAKEHKELGVEEMIGEVNKRIGRRKEGNG